jgi:hypothetical protein
MLVKGPPPLYVLSSLNLDSSLIFLCQAPEFRAHSPVPHTSPKSGAPESSRRDTYFPERDHVRKMSCQKGTFVDIHYAGSPPPFPA